MGKVAIHYFTGTGNTRDAVNTMAEVLSAGGHSVTKIDITRDKTEFNNDFELHFFVWAVYSWSAPAMYKSYIRKLKGNDKPAVVYAVHGGADEGGNPGQGVGEVSRILKRRGFRVISTGRVGYPTNWIQFSNPITTEAAKSVIEISRTEVRKFTTSILKGEELFFKNSIIGTILSKFSAIAFSLAGRKILGEVFIADEKCNSCGICSKSCVCGCIKMTGKKKHPRWGANCENCNRCMNICPQQAIQTSTLKLILHLTFHIGGIVAGAIIGFQLIDKYLVLDMSWLMVIMKIAAFFLIMTVVLLVELYILNPILNILASVPGVKKLFYKSFTTNFNRYKAPGFKPEQ